MDFVSEYAIYIVGFLAFLVIAGVGLALTGDASTERAAKRAKQLSEEGRVAGKGRGKADESTARRKQTQAMLNKLRDQDKQRRESLMSKGIDVKLMQAGLDIPPSTFWIASAIMAAVMAALAWYSGAAGPPPVMGFDLREILGEEVARIVTIVAAAIAGGIGVPRWVLGFLAAGRNKKMLNQFADGIDVIVRGVKSGLPLTECLQIIARESAAPLGPEIKSLTDNIQMGMTMDRALTQFYKRVPLSEVNFFVIVLSIQAKAGGNLSEALGNLSAVIRSRKMMREKIKALSSEAKASAMIIGCLPFAVAFMVYLTTPAYIMELFITSTGHMILFMGACLMSLGIFVMRQMINFDV